MEMRVWRGMVWLFALIVSPVVAQIVAPLDLSLASSTPKTLTISWQPSTGGTAPYIYTVLRNGAVVGSVTTTSLTLKSLQPATSYLVVVRAKDKAGALSPDSPESLFTTPADTTAPTIPGSLAIGSLTASSALLQWAASTDDVRVAGYEILLNGKLIPVGTVVSKALSGLAPSTAYEVKLCAKDSSGNRSDYSTPLTFSTGADVTAPTAPGAPVVTTVGAGSVTVKWPAAKDDVKVSSYELYKNDVFYAKTTALSRAVTGLIPLTEYKFAVTASDAAGHVSSPSDSLVVSTLPDTLAPTVPTALKAASITTSSLKLSWAASKDDVGVDHYNLYSGGAFHSVSFTNSLVVSNLKPATSYLFSVSALDATGNPSAPTADLLATTLADTTRPTAPTGLAASLTTGRSTTLTWMASKDNVAVDSYDIFNRGSLFANVSGPSYLASGLTPSTAYVFTVKARDASGNTSTSSNGVNVTTLVHSNIPPTCSFVSPSGSPSDRVTTCSSNIPPTCSFVSPAPDSSVTIGVPLDIRATASDPDGSVDYIDFSDDEISMQRGAGPLFERSYSPTGIGVHRLTVVATDHTGDSSTPFERLIRVLPHASGYQCDFEPTDGLNSGSLSEQRGWVVSQGCADIAADLSGSNRVALRAGLVPPVLEQVFGSRGDNPSLVWADLIVKPFAGDSASTATFLELDSGLLAFVSNGSIGQFHYLDGDGAGGGHWKAIETPFALESGGVTCEFVRVSVRLDYLTKQYSVYLDGKLAVTRAHFRFGAANYFSWLAFNGNLTRDVWLDEVRVGPNCPLFDDRDLDGLDDTWELGNGLSVGSVDAASDLDGDGLSNQDEFARGTKPQTRDSDGDGFEDGVEVDLRTNPLVADIPGPSYSGERPRFRFRADLGLRVDAAGRVATWSDLSGNGDRTLEIQEGAGPLPLLNALGSNAALHFDGHGFRLARGMAGAVQGHIFVVLRVAPILDTFNTVANFGQGYGTGFFNDERMEDFGLDTATWHACYPGREDFHLLELSVSADGTLREYIKLRYRRLEPDFKTRDCGGRESIYNL
jgi:chitodextrinase